MFGEDPAARRASLEQTYTEEPAQDGERTVTLRRVGDIQALMVVYHGPAGAHPGRRRARCLCARARRDALGPAVQGAGR